jgi:hypothetical protein
MLAIFFAIKAIRYALTVVLISLAALGRSCSLETQQEMEIPKVEALLKVPTVDEILTIAVPSALVILAILFATAWCLSRSATGARERHGFVEGSLYVVGFQYLLAPIAFGVWLALPASLKAADVSYYVGGVAFVAMAWPARLFALQIPS